jgi:squalene cyclase
MGKLLTVLAVVGLYLTFAVMMAPVMCAAFPNLYPTHVCQESKP